MNEKPYQSRWGIVGLGRVVTGRFVPALSRSKRSTLAACVTRNPEAAGAFAEKYDVSKVYASFDQLITDPDIDVTYLATPNLLHYEQSRQALLAGKHVLCEKPLALKIEEGKELIETAKRAGRLLGVAYQLRFEHLFERVRDHVRTGAIGDIRSIRMFGAAAFATHPAGWRQNPAEGGILTDLAVHLLDLVSWLTGLEFVEVSAIANPTEPDRSPIQTISVLGRLGQNCHGIIGATREVANGQNSLTIEGTSGAIVIAQWRGAAEYELVLLNGANRNIEKISASQNFEREIDAFEDEIGGKSTNLAKGVDGLRTIVVADAVLQSLRDGRVVKVGRLA